MSPFCVEIKAKKVTPKFLNLGVGNGEIMEIETELPWNPPRSTSSKVSGHTLHRWSHLHQLEK